MNIVYDKICKIKDLADQRLKIEKDLDELLKGNVCTQEEYDLLHEIALLAFDGEKKRVIESSISEPIDDEDNSEQAVQSVSQTQKKLSSCKGILSSVHQITASLHASVDKMAMSTLRDTDDPIIVPFIHAVDSNHIPIEDCLVDKVSEEELEGTVLHNVSTKVVETSSKEVSAAKRKRPVATKDSIERSAKSLQSIQSNIMAVVTQGDLQTSLNNMVMRLKKKGKKPVSDKKIRAKLKVNQCFRAACNNIPDPTPYEYNSPVVPKLPPLIVCIPSRKPVVAKTSTNDVPVSHSIQIAPSSNSSSKSSSCSSSNSSSSSSSNNNNNSNNSICSINGNTSISNNNNNNNNANRTTTGLHLASPVTSCSSNLAEESNSSFTSHGSGKENRNSRSAVTSSSKESIITTNTTYSKCNNAGTIIIDSSSSSKNTTRNIVRDKTVPMNNSSNKNSSNNKNSNYNKNSNNNSISSSSDITTNHPNLSATVGNPSIAIIPTITTIQTCTPPPPLTHSNSSSSSSSNNNISSNSNISNNRSISSNSNISSNSRSSNYNSNNIKVEKEVDDDNDNESNYYCNKKSRRSSSSTSSSTTSSSPPYSLSTWINMILNDSTAPCAGNNLLQAIHARKNPSYQLLKGSQLDLTPTYSTATPPPDTAACNRSSGGGGGGGHSHSHSHCYDLQFLMARWWSHEYEQSFAESKKINKKKKREIYHISTMIKITTEGISLGCWTKKHLKRFPIDTAIANLYLVLAKLPGYNMPPGKLLSVMALPINSDVEPFPRSICESLRKLWMKLNDQSSSNSNISIESSREEVK